MKTIKLLIIIFTAILTPSLRAENYDMGSLNSKVKNIIDAKLHINNTAFDIKNLLDSPEFTSLREKCLTDWQQIGSNVDHIGHGDEGYRLVFLAMSFLPPENYISLLELSVTKYDNNLLSETKLKSLLFNEGGMGSFVVDNYQHARVVSVLHTIKNKTADENFVLRIQGILNGTAKSSLDDYREGHEGLGEGITPEVILPN